MANLQIGDAVMRTTTSATAEIDGQLVALDVTQGVCYGLNHVATRIWALIEQPHTGQAIVDQLAEEYDVDVDTCRDHTLALLNDLVEAGLATASPQATA